MSQVHLAICWKTRESAGTRRTITGMRSDNPSGAEDQQERLIRIGWVVGFVDGEGCFSIGFVKQPDRARRRGYTSGYQVSHASVVTQGLRSAACLEELHEFFGVGRSTSIGVTTTTGKTSCSTASGDALICSK
jgi:hypothetical protein